MLFQCGIPSPVHWARSAELDSAPVSKDQDSETDSVLWASDYAVEGKDVYFVKSMAVFSGDRRRSRTALSRVLVRSSDIYILHGNRETSQKSVRSSTQVYMIKIGQFIFSDQTSLLGNFASRTACLKNLKHRVRSFMTFRRSQLCW